MDFSEWSADDIFDPFLIAIEELQIKNIVEFSITAGAYYIHGCEGHVDISLEKIWNNQLKISFNWPKKLIVSEKEFVRALLDEAHVTYSELMRNHKDFSRIEKLRAIYQL